MRVLLFTPPMVQVNTPYPATPQLTGFLRSHGIEAQQRDPSIELVCRLFSREGLQRIRAEVITRFAPGAASDTSTAPDSIRFFLEAFDDYARTVEPVIRFLQGKDPALAHRLASRTLVPEGPRFLPLHELPDSLEWSFGTLGIQDHAKHIASLYLDDLADVVRQGVDPRFELSRYGEKLAASQPSFDGLQAALERPGSLIDQMLEEVLVPHLKECAPDLVGISVPFPGNMLGAMRCAQIVRKYLPGTRIAIGGGYVNTELRELDDARLFDYVDFVTLDDGERPFLCLVDHLRGGRPVTGLLRTFVRVDGRVRFISASGEHDIPQKDCGFPTYDGLPLELYISMLEMLNPMHRLWSDLRWNKLMLAHGCYWKKCTFCDTSLDYIGRYDPASADLVIDRMERIIAETGQTGFHFTDEAAPPALLRALSRRLRERGLTVSWWGNIRFDKAFTPELAAEMADAGCVAVSGGLEAASDRLLGLMQKGVTVEQVARVTKAFREAGILVHAYLMYGFPSQSEQETIDSLERVRQLFRTDCIQSAFWHRFAATAHSPVGRDPGRYGVRVHETQTAPGRRFARNDLPFTDSVPTDHGRLGEGLRKAVYNYMLGLGLEEDVRTWFATPVPPTTVNPRLVERAIKRPAGGPPAKPGQTPGLPRPSAPADQIRRIR